MNSETIANWKANSGEKYTIPINVFASKLTRIGPFPFSIQGGAGYYVETPDNGPDWQLRMVFVVLLPKEK